MSRNTVYLIACLLLFFGIAMRFLPHLPNATPITAIAFVASVYLGKRWAVSLPLLTLFLSDLLIGFYEWEIMLVVYGSFAMIALLSIIAVKHNLFVGFLLTGPLLFFLLTNAAVWAFSPWYEKTVGGLLYAYELGLPFLKNMFLGDVLYTVLLVGMFEGIRTLSASRLRWHAVQKRAC